MARDIQVGDVPLVLRLNIHPMSISKEINRLEIIHESSGIDDGDTSIQSGNLVETTFSDKFG